MHGDAWRFDYCLVKSSIILSSESNSSKEIVTIPKYHSLPHTTRSTERWPKTHPLHQNNDDDDDDDRNPLPAQTLTVNVFVAVEFPIPPFHSSSSSTQARVALQTFFSSKHDVRLRVSTQSVLDTASFELRVFLSSRLSF